MSSLLQVSAMAQLTALALERFRRHGAPYDVAAAQLTLARIAGERGNCIEAVDHADQARSAIEAGGYRVLYRLFATLDVPAAARGRAGLVTFAAGDALGVPWEGQPPNKITPDQIATTPARDVELGVRPDDLTGQGHPRDRHAAQRGISAAERSGELRLVHS